MQPHVRYTSNQTAVTLQEQQTHLGSVILSVYSIYLASCELALMFVDVEPSHS